MIRSLWFTMALAATLLLAGPTHAQDGGDAPPAPDPVETVRSGLADILAASDAVAPDAVTISDPDISVAALGFLLEPMTLEELRAETSAWADLLRDSAQIVADAELELLAITEAEETAADEDGETGGTDVSAPPKAAPESPEKTALIERIAKLREARTSRLDRLRLVMDEFENKGGDPVETSELRAYGAAVSGINVDVSDYEAAYLTVTEWLTAEEGGRRIFRRCFGVVLSMAAGGLIGWIISTVVNIGLRQSDMTSTLLRHFLSRWIVWIGVLVGLLMGLSSIGVNMTPILAGLGAAGLVLGLALQNTIGNFASGLLILFQRPFDMGDEIESAGVAGVVEQVSLFSTYLSTSENRKVIIPNNMIWEDVIVNSTGAPTRRLLIEVEVDPSHSFEETEAKLMDIMTSKPYVLDSPPPDLKLGAISADGMTFTCRPWVRTEDRDDARWDLVAAFNREFTLLSSESKVGRS